MNDRCLFRGRPKDGYWIIGGYVQLGNYHYILYSNDHEGAVIKVEVDPKTIGQCTGLKDKNGKLIFENDIAKTSVFRHGSNKNWYSTKNENHGNDLYFAYTIITWDIDRYKLKQLPITKKQLEEIRKPKGREINIQSANITYHLLERKSNELEIIGNIYDNPELLEV